MMRYASKMARLALDKTLGCNDGKFWPGISIASVNYRNAMHLSFLIIFSQNRFMLKHNYAGRRFLRNEAYREMLLYCSSPRTLCLLAAAFIACLTACGGSSKPPFPPVPGPPPATQHLYAAGATSHALQFPLPLTSSTPSATLSLAIANDVTGMAVDPAGNVALGDTSGNISIFNGPITASASPSVTFKNGTSTFAEGLAFNSAGDLFATTNGNSINVFTHPFTSASTPSQVITSANLSRSVGVVLDSANNLIVSNSPSLMAGANLVVFAPPYTAPPIASAVVPASNYGEMAISGTQLFVVNSLVSTSRIEVYNLPIAQASTSAFLITNGLFGGSVSAAGVAVDSSGNLYAGLGGNLGTTDSGGVRIYAPPFSASSAPNVTTGVGAFSLAVGK
jgi:hypothetical protein